jgi:hypothetical protein
MMYHIFKHFKCFTIQIFLKFKYDIPHILEKIYRISIYFSLQFLNLRSRANNPLNTPYKSSKQKNKPYKSKNI